MQYQFFKPLGFLASLMVLRGLSHDCFFNAWDLQYCEWYRLLPSQPACPSQCKGRTEDLIVTNNLVFPCSWDSTIMHHSSFRACEYQHSYPLVLPEQVCGVQVLVNDKLYLMLPFYKGFVTILFLNTVRIKTLLHYAL